MDDLRQLVDEGVTGETQYKNALPNLFAQVNSNDSILSPEALQEGATIIVIYSPLGFF